MLEGNRTLSPDEQDELQSLCRRLWRYVRYFGLCGADPEAVEAVVRMGELLGMVAGPSPTVTLETVDAAAHLARREALDQAKSWLENHRFMGRQILKQHAAALVEEFKGLK
jgi:hypothetical protein